MAVVLFLIAGFLLGGVITLVRQGATKVSIGVVAVLAALAADGTVEPAVVKDAIARYDLDVDAVDPRLVDLA